MLEPEFYTGLTNQLRELMQNYGRKRRDYRNEKLTEQEFQKQCQRMLADAYEKYEKFILESV